MSVSFSFGNAEMNIDTSRDARRVIGAFLSYVEVENVDLDKCDAAFPTRIVSKTWK